MKIFISYTSSDREWAHWIGWHLLEAGHEPLVHEWEVNAGENIPRWMEASLNEADRLLGVFSDAYCDALYSQSERWAAHWQDPGGRIGFLVPVEVRQVTKWPVFIKPLKRVSLIDLNESEAVNRLVGFLQPSKRPSKKPNFPGEAKNLSLRLPSFAEGGDPLGSDRPRFPVNRPDEKSQRAQERRESQGGDAKSSRKNIAAMTKTDSNIPPTRQLVVVHLSDIHFGEHHRFAPGKAIGPGKLPIEGFPTLVETLQKDLNATDQNVRSLCVLLGIWRKRGKLTNSRRPKCLLKNSPL